MADPVLIICGGVPRAAVPRPWQGLPKPVVLQIGRGRGHVHLEIRQLAWTLQTGMPDVAADLLELAAYVYTADQAIPRGGTKEFEYGARWRRYLKLIVPVRQPAVWDRPAVREALLAALRFLPDDEFEFGFVEAARPARPSELKEPDFDAVRGRADFQMLFAEVEGKAEKLPETAPPPRARK